MMGVVSSRQAVNQQRYFKFLFFDADWGAAVTVLVTAGVAAFGYRGSPTASNAPATTRPIDAGPRNKPGRAATPGDRPARLRTALQRPLKRSYVF